MTTLHDKIAALPPMPQPLLNPNYPGETVRQFREQYWVDVARAALSRLALAREWIEANDRPCSREEILAALEGPP